MNPVYFDCETEPLPADELAQFMPEFQAPSNYKDPEKIRANIADQQARWIEDGALSAVTGRVLCIGTLRDKNFDVWADDEKQMLADFWGFASGELQAGRTLIGFCVKTFDLPFLVRRSWKHGVKVPFCLWSGRYFADGIIDVAELWQCANRDPRDRVSLDTLSKFLGIGAKTGDGKEFAGLWRTDKEKAKAYLHNDLTLTQRAYSRISGIE